MTASSLYPQYTQGWQGAIDFYVNAAAGDTLTVATSPAAPIFTLKDATGTVVVGYNGIAVSGYSSGALVQDKAWYYLDTSALQPGVYTAESTLYVTKTSDGKTVREVVLYTFEVVPDVATAVPRDVQPPLHATLSNGADLFILSLAESGVTLYATLSDTPAPGEVSTLSLVGASAPAFNLRPFGSGTFIDNGAAAAIEAGVPNEVGYTFTSADMTALAASGPGLYQGSFRVSLASGAVHEFPGLLIQVNAADA